MEKKIILEGVCSGQITLTKEGKQGFGYDPIFKPDGFEKTFAEMSKLEKGAISHRGRVKSETRSIFEKITSCQRLF